MRAEVMVAEMASRMADDLVGLWDEIVVVSKAGKLVVRRVALTDASQVVWTAAKSGLPSAAKTAAMKVGLKGLSVDTLVDMTADTWVYKKAQTKAAPTVSKMAVVKAAWLELREAAHSVALLVVTMVA